MKRFTLLPIRQLHRYFDALSVHCRNPEESHADSQISMTHAVADTAQCDLLAFYTTPVDTVLHLWWLLRKLDV
jgi:hypothetical protein